MKTTDTTMFCEICGGSNGIECYRVDDEREGWAHPECLDPRCESDAGIETYDSNVQVSDQ